MKERLQGIRTRICQAAEKADRDPAAITLVGVSKTWPVPHLAKAYEAGLRHFGENRPEELAQKRPELEALLGNVSDITWHKIGTVQSRKSKFVALHADYFHALDRLKIAHRLSQQRPKGAPILPVLLEVNVSGEASKAGFAAQHWESDPAQVDRLVAAIQELQTLPNLQIQGLMTMAPWGSPETEILQVFQRTKALADHLNETLGVAILSDLSMGMSGDFELAIAAGATHVRVGSAIFGSRY